MKWFTWQCQSPSHQSILPYGYVLRLAIYLDEELQFKWVEYHQSVDSQSRDNHPLVDVVNGGREQQVLQFLYIALRKTQFGEYVYEHLLTIFLLLLIYHIQLLLCSLVVVLQLQQGNIRDEALQSLTDFAPRPVAPACPHLVAQGEEIIVI